jgi:glycosyltransferase involved in cell wall biosynthesis
VQLDQFPVAIVPCRNEAGSIAQVIDELRGIGIPRILIGLDPNSSDGTGAIAKDRGVEVIIAPQTGYDSPCLAALDYLRADHYDGDVMILDAGNKYYMDSIKQFLLEADEKADLTSGIRDTALLWHQKLGNTFFRAVLQIRFGQPVLDISSVRLFSVPLADQLRLEDRQFSLPFQTIVHALALHKTIHYIPIRCTDNRTGVSKVSGSKRNSAKAAKQMLLSLVRIPKFT